MSNKEAVALILNNLQAIEQATNLIYEEIQPNVFKIINQLIEKKLTQFNDEIIGIYDFCDDETWFLPKQWHEEEFDIKDSKTWKNMYAYFELTNEGVEEKTNHFWITSFFENSMDRMVFNFSLYESGFDKASKKDWKIFNNNIYRSYPQLEQLGFKFNASVGNWYLPIESLNKELFIQNYIADTLEDALTPIINALESVEKSLPYFSEIIIRAKQKFNQPYPE